MSTKNIVAQTFIFCKRLRLLYKKDLHWPTEKKIITRFVNRRMPSVLRLHLLFSDRNIRRSRAPLFNTSIGFLYYYLWIFFAFPIAPRRLTLFYQNKLYLATERLTFFAVYHKILLVNFYKGKSREETYQL